MPIKIKSVLGSVTLSAENVANDQTLTVPSQASATLQTTADTITSSRLTGALPALDGSSLTGVGGITADAGTVTAPTNADDFIVENSGDAGLSVLYPSNSSGTINFGCPSPGNADDQSITSYGVSHATKANYIEFKTNQTLRLRIDNSGRVTMPNMPCAVGRWTPDVASGNKIPPSRAIDINVGGHLATSGRFTCPVAGQYLVLFSGMGSTSTSLVIRLKKNGSLYAGIDGYNHTTTYAHIGASVVATCAANDYLELWVENGTLHTDYGSFTYRLLG